MAIDAVLVGKGTTTTTPITTASGTTTTGSTFVVAIALHSSRTIDSVTDNKGNTYTEVDSQIASSILGARMFYCANGTGGAGHVATVAISGGAAWATGHLIEITGAATASFDTFAKAVSLEPQPYVVTTPTLAQAASVVITICATNFGADLTYSSGNTTILSQQTATTGPIWPNAVSKLVTSATTAVTPSFTAAPSGSAFESVLMAAVFKEAAAGGATQHGALMLVGVG